MSKAEMIVRYFEVMIGEEISNRDVAIFQVQAILDAPETPKEKLEDAAREYISDAERDV